jgi:hypothetical protein
VETPKYYQADHSGPRCLSDVKVDNYYSSLAPNNRDKRAAMTTSSILVALHEEAHIGPIAQGFIGNRLQGTDVSEFIHARYGTLVKFLQDGTRHDDFVLTVGSKGTCCFIDHAPKLVLPKPVSFLVCDTFAHFLFLVCGTFAQFLLLVLPHFLEEQQQGKEKETLDTGLEDTRFHCRPRTIEDPKKIKYQEREEEEGEKERVESEKEEEE